MKKPKLKTNIIKVSASCLIAGPLLTNTLHQFANGNAELGLISAIPLIIASRIAFSGFRDILEKNNKQEHEDIVNSL